MAQTTLTYLERRYAALETEIANALLHRPTDDLVIADLSYRKLITWGKITPICMRCSPRSRHQQRRKHLPPNRFG